MMLFGTSVRSVMGSKGRKFKKREQHDAIEEGASTKKYVLKFEPRPGPTTDKCTRPKYT